MNDRKIVNAALESDIETLAGLLRDLTSAMEAQSRATATAVAHRDELAAVVEAYDAIRQEADKSLDAVRVMIAAADAAVAALRATMSDFHDLLDYARSVSAGGGTGEER